MAYDTSCGSILPPIYPGGDWSFAWSVEQTSETDPYLLTGTIVLRLMSGSIKLAEAECVVENAIIYGGFTAAATQPISVATPSPQLLMVHHTDNGNTYVLFARRVDIRALGAA